MKFRLTFEVVTEESAVNGDFARHGFVTRNFRIPYRTYMPKNPAEFTLRDAIEFLISRESRGPVEADSCPVSRNNPPRWFNYGGEWDHAAGGYVTIGLHLPDSVTPSSALRIARYLKCYGVK